MTGRRALFTAAATAGVGAAVLGSTRGASAADRTEETGRMLPSRRPGRSPKDGSAYPDRDASYARGAASVTPRVSPRSGPPPVAAASPEAAAEAARPAAPTVLSDAPELHLLRRFTFGPTPEMVEQVRSWGVGAWLTRQLIPRMIPDDTADGVWRQYPLVDLSTAQLHEALDRNDQSAMAQYGRATLARQIWSRRQLFEVMVDFWANHLNVPIPTRTLWDVGTTYHNTVIRKHALGRFRDMLHDAMRHPAMLRYLNNDVSHKDSVNENLGRELLELHTVGVDGGYDEDDVRNSAYILTGRTVRRNGEFVYDADRHYTGTVSVMGFRHTNRSGPNGLAVGDKYLAYLATHQSTAQYIARKLAVRFVSDDPPASLVDRLAAVYRAADTAIVPVLLTLAASPEFWESVGQKTRRPLENVVAAARALDVRPGDDTVAGVSRIYAELGRVGHRPLKWDPPNGYPDVAAAWASAGGMLGTWNIHRSLVRGQWAGLTYTDPAELVDKVPGKAKQYVDALCRRLLHQKMRPRHRTALLEFLDGSESGADAAKLAAHLVPLVLDSPYFALR